MENKPNVAKGKDKISILFITRYGFEFFDAYSGSVFFFETPKNLVSDLEVIDSKELKDAIILFIQNNNLTPCTLTIVLSSDVTIEKEFAQKGQAQTYVDIQNFIDNIPYESVDYRKQSLDNITKITAVNKDLYLIPQQAFEEKGFTINFILPVTFYNAPVPSLGKTAIDIILRKSAGGRNLSFSGGQKISYENGEQSNSKDENTRKNLILVSIFAALMITASALVLFALGII